VSAKDIFCFFGFALDGGFSVIFLAFPISGMTEKNGKSQGCFKNTTSIRTSLHPLFVFVVLIVVNKMDGGEGHFGL